MELYTLEYFMQEALKEARKALEKGEVPVGAVVVCQNKIIARAHNQTEQLNDATAHAEMLAVTAASNYLAWLFSDQKSITTPSHGSTERYQWAAKQRVTLPVL
jgi:tRNA(adenine34) deaminase